MVRRVLRRWHGIRVYISADKRTKRVKIVPDEFDLGRTDSMNLIRFWGQCLRWTLEFETKNPEWKVNGTVSSSKEDPDEKTNFYMVV